MLAAEAAVTQPGHRNPVIVVGVSATRQDEASLCGLKSD